MKFASNLVTKVSGSIGGITGSHNRGGMYFRARSTPTNPGTTYQSSIRQLLAQLAVLWSSTLTEAQRAAWTAYGNAVAVTDVLGETRYLTGLQHYLRSNVARLQAGLARVDDGPTVYTLPDMTTPVITATETDDEISVAYTNTDAWAQEVGGALIVLASRMTGVGINYFKGPYRYCDLVAGAATPPTSPETMTAPFPLNTDGRLFLQVRACRADGRLSAPYRTFCVPA